MRRLNILIVGLIFAFIFICSISAAAEYDREVYQAQKALKELGYNLGEVDGLWGKRTQGAVERYQRNVGLPVTGRLDDQTKWKLGIGLSERTTRRKLGQIEGSVQGFLCVTLGKLCPVGKEDPIIATERVFVVLTAGKKYYFVPNVDRGILARHINERVRITGIVSTKFNSINANIIEVFKNGAWKTAWTLEWEKEMLGRE
jgi:peptidoglycan hydrolase-like protein with peptidoglycan-binding domain